MSAPNEDELVYGQAVQIAGLINKVAEKAATNGRRTTATE